MAEQRIEVVNLSQHLAPEDFADYLQAINKQLLCDYQPIYKSGAPTLSPLAPNAAKSKDSWLVVVLDNSDQADALGYHELAADGSPLGKIFVEADLVSGSQVSVTLSHEVLEMVADPYINTTVEVEWGPEREKLILAKEICDPCEDDRYAYSMQIDSGRSIAVSDFVTPDYFQSVNFPAKAYDVVGGVSRPMEILMGGYQLKREGRGDWVQVTSLGQSSVRDLHLVDANNSQCRRVGGLEITKGSRRYRRMIPDSQWRVSKQ